MGFWKSLVGDDPSVSTTRLQSLVLVVVGICIAVGGFIAWWIYNRDLTGVIGLAGMLIGCGVTGKAIQNVMIGGGNDKQ